FDWRFDYFASERRSFQFRLSHDQRNAHRGIQKIRFMDQIVIAVHLPVTGSEQDDSPVPSSSGFNLLENFSDLIVDQGHFSCVTIAQLSRIADPAWRFRDLLIYFSLGSVTSNSMSFTLFRFVP